ncbi:MAG: NAD(P)/FAD-dependent oxidoreductase, partial [Vicinamibacterales bacterium]
MTAHDADLVVVGAGPAGLCAAIEAARAGLDVLVVDENARPGGQIFRQVPGAFSVTHAAGLGREHAQGQALFDELKGLPIRFLLESTVWGSFEERVLEVALADRTLQLRARAIVLAAGAYDRPVPLPGWTLPGVFTVGGAQTILKSQRIVPGRRILMAGTGPLQLVVASQLAKAGAEIVAVADPVPTWRTLRYTAALLRAWSITRDGLAYRRNLLKARVPWITPTVLVRIDGREGVERATIARVDAAWRPIAGTERTFEVDTVCIGYGLVPSIELPRLLGCRLELDEAAAVWVPRRN